MAKDYYDMADWLLCAIYDNEFEAKYDVEAEFDKELIKNGFTGTERDEFWNMLQRNHLLKGADRHFFPKGGNFRLTFEGYLLKEGGGFKGRNEEVQKEKERVLFLENANAETSREAVRVQQQMVQIQERMEALQVDAQGTQKEFRNLQEAIRNLTRWIVLISAIGGIWYVIEIAKFFYSWFHAPASPF